MRGIETLSVWRWGCYDLIQAVRTEWGEGDGTARHFENGVIVPDAGCELSQGERVEIRKLPDDEPSESTLTERFDWMIGAAPDLPPDFSIEHDISFVVMDRFKLTEALTADHHFEQAGFVAMLKPKTS